MTKRNFQDLVTSRAVIASAPVDEDQFAAILKTVNERFGLTLVPREEAYEFFRDQIRVVAGRFWDEVEAAERKIVLERLCKFTDNVISIIAQLFPLREGLHEVADTEVVSLLIHGVNLAHSGQHPRPREELETILKLMEGLEQYCWRALLILEEHPAKKGQRGLRWYTDHVKLMIRIADLLGMKVSTAGDRIEDAHATPFTVLVFEAERVLPEEAWSDSLAACAKRIERSLTRLKASPRRNASKS
jgi:hypothetical protein